MKPNPPKPREGLSFYHHYGYEMPMAFLRWEWSDTFGRWAGVVIFYDGWQGFTWPNL